MHYSIPLTLVWSVVVVVAGLLVSYFGPNICERETCIDKSNLIAEHMNLTADPCNDFPSFVCGAAFSHSQKNATQNANGNQFTVMEDEVSKYLSQKLFSVLPDKSKLKTHGHLASTIQQFYQMCRVVFDDTVQLPYRANHLAAFDQPLRRLFTLSFPGFTDFGSTFNETTAAEYEFNSKKMGLFGHSLFSTKITFVDDRPVLTVGPPDFAVFTATDVEKMYENYPNSPSKQLGQGFVDTFRISVNNATLPWMQRMFFFLYKVTRAYTESSQGDVNGTARVTKTISIQDLKKELQFFDWELYFKLLIKYYNEPLVLKKKDTNIPKTILLVNPKYFELLKGLVLAEKFSCKRVAYTIVFKNYLDLLAFRKPDYDQQEYRKIIATEYISSYNNRDAFCRNFVEKRFGNAVTSLMIENFRIKDGGQQIVNKILKTVKLEVTEAIEKSQWMDNVTKEIAIKKIETMLFDISVSDKDFKTLKNYKSRTFYYRNFCVKDNIVKSILCINKFIVRRHFELWNRKRSAFDEDSSAFGANIRYHYKRNELVVPVSMLRAPAFDHRWPSSLNFAGIGAIIAKELLKACDERGSGYDLIGRRIQGVKGYGTWWSNATLVNYYKKQKECLEMLVAEKEWITKILTCEISTEPVNSSSCYMRIREAEGVQFAFRAFKKSLKSNFLNPLSSPGPLRKFPILKEFFIAYGNLFCAVRPASKFFNNLTNNFTLSSVEDSTKRLNLMSQIDEFQKVFECKKSPLEKLLRTCKMF